MFILPIWLIDGPKWSWNSINSGIPSYARSEQGTHENWRVAQNQKAKQILRFAKDDN